MSVFVVKSGNEQHMDDPKGRYSGHQTKRNHLCRYIIRPAISEERLKLTPSGDVILKLKTKYSDGTSHHLFSGLEFVEKLAALGPPPRVHLTRFHGALAPNSKLRKHVVPQKEEPPEQSAPTQVEKPGS